jgi:hypothetical protein
MEAAREPKGPRVRSAIDVMEIPDGRPTSHIVLTATSAISSAVTTLYSQHPSKAVDDAAKPDACSSPHQ